MWQGLQSKHKKLLFVLPALIFVSFFFLYALGYSLLQSLGLNPIVGDSAFTLNHYGRILSGDFPKILAYTVRLSLRAGVLSLGVSVLVLFALSFFLESRFMAFLFNSLRLPMLVPYLSASYMIFLLLMDNGVLGRAVGRSFPDLLNDQEGWGITLTYLWKTAPFFITMSFPVLLRIYGHWNELAYSLKVGKIKFFTTIALPLMAPSLIISFFIITAYIFSSFEIPFILGSLSPRTLAVYIYNIYTRGDLSQRPYLMAVNMVLVFLSLFFGLISYVFYRHFERKIKGWE